MAEEGYYYESRFVCKLCYKKFPCGKSLGGHMRSHVVANSTESEQFLDKKIQSFDDLVHQTDPKDSRIADFANGQQSNYVLRENPKKTWRAVDNSRIPLPQDKICKQCGKGFQSMKALCGHMACHSDRDKNFKDDGSWTSENQKPVFDSCSDSDEEAEERRMRTRSSSKNKRYKKFVEKSHFFALASNINNVNGSSSVTEIDGQDQEEVAMCLMLLSRDMGNNNNNNNNSVVESSDNNSVVLETKSSSIEMMMIGKRESLTYTHKQDDEEKIGVKKLKGKILDVDSDSDYFLDECANKAESELSVDGFRKYGAFGDDYGVEFRKSLKVIKNELRTENRPNDGKKSKYECFNCKKAFKSYQALGGHRPCHKRTNVFYEPRYESGENSLDDSTDYAKKKTNAKNEKKTKLNKNKSHVCPFCDRVFKNGQALGGHKRSHFIGGHLENDSQTRTKARDLLDLNLPAPEADGDNEQRGQFDY
ncbi:zinc finger protein zat9 [Phtheirospermum japonicum]|uniref:Zinc finger protein zat9 n=1 Tax=Phtheirospermum japonicum TaxID=374723 RepID=A0A830BPH2_9LAMI|nr:zinc finger protein zat9 [Phtheirospermum japonicum]